MIDFVFPKGGFPLWFAGSTFLVAVAVAGLWGLERRYRARLRRFIDASLEPRLVCSTGPGARRTVFWLPVAGLVFLALAVAQPHWGLAPQRVRHYSRDVLVLLDTSESMRADDVAPSRLERAKEKIAFLLQRTPGDRVGLVCFSGAAELVCPLTHDHAYVRAVLHTLDTNTIGLEGTDIAAAIERAAETFRLDDGPAAAQSSRAFVLLSDGEQVSGDAVAAAERAGDIGPLFVMGLGAPDGASVSAPVEERRAARQGTAQGHLSVPDEEGLGRIAVAGNGVYVRAQADQWDVDHLWRRLDALGEVEVGSEARVRRANRFQWPLTLAVACFAAEGLWWIVLARKRVRGRGALAGGPPHG